VERVQYNRARVADNASEQQAEETLWKSPTTWQAYCDQACQNEELTHDDQQYVCSGLRVLGQILGDDFLQRIFRLNLPKSEGRHPLVYILGNGAPSAQLYLGRLGETLKALEGVQRFQILKKFLKEASRFNSAVAHAEVAAKLQSAGYEIELEPKVRNGRADVFARKSGDEFLIEVSTVGEGAEGKYARETAHAIWPRILVTGCIPGGRIHRILSEGERNKYQSEIEDVIEEVKTKGCCREIEHTGAFDIFIAPRDKAKELDICLRAKGMEYGCCGPLITTDQINRVMTRFDDKISQLPKDKPGIVVVYANDLTPFYMARDQVLEEIAHGMEQIVANKHNIILFVLVVPEGCFENRNRYARTDLGNNRTIVQRPLVRGSRENILAVNNMNARFSSPPEIRGAFINA
jgi:hypothetical protein